VNLQLNADNTITVSVTLQTPYILWGAGQAVFGFNYNGTGTLSVLNYTGSSVSGWSFQGPGLTSMDGFGKFQYALTNSANQNLGNTLIFTVASSVGFTSVNQLGIGTDNSNGYAFAAHIADNPDAGRVTGFTGSTGPSPVPEPASMALIGSGLVALGGYMRRRKRG
jgi:hypothetical protein